MTFIKVLLSLCLTQPKSSSSFYLKLMAKKRQIVRRNYKSSSHVQMTIYRLQRLGQKYKCKVQHIYIAHTRYIVHKIQPDQHHILSTILNDGLPETHGNYFGFLMSFSILSGPEILKKLDAV